jgi:hypothetical protein
MSPQSWTRLMEAGRELRNLSQLIDAEAGRQADGGNIVRALELTIANLRLGSMLSRGSDVFISVDGSVASYFAERRLARLESDLTSDQMRMAIEALSRVAAEREPIESIRARDAAYQQRIWGWMGRLQYVMNGLFHAPDLERPEILWRVQVIQELPRTDLALRLYQREQGPLPPDSLAALVPKYLPSVPIDPYTNRPLVYRVDRGGYTLYSVGQDGRDDAGRFTNLRNYVTGSGFDFDLDTPARP